MLHSKSLLHLSSDLPIFYCTITLLPLLFVDPRQLPPSHPAAPPEHLKEPLAYMRKAQVSLSALISVTPASTTDLNLCSFPQFHSCCFSQLCICIICSQTFPRVCALSHRPAGRSASSKAWTAWAASSTCLWLAWYLKACQSHLSFQQLLVFSSSL